MNNFSELAMKSFAILVMSVALYLFWNNANASTTDRPIGAVTSASSATLCVSGYSATVRPSASYTSALKRKWVPAGHKVSEYELDHSIPISIGGDPYNEANLWLQDWANAKRKDIVESQLHRDLCNGKITLNQAQDKIQAWK
jgi:hypothetical protein